MYCLLSTDPGDVHHNHPTQTPVDESHVIEHTESCDSPQDTSPEQSTQGDSSQGEENSYTPDTKSAFSPSHKSVRFANGHTDQDQDHYSPDQELLALSNPNSPDLEKVLYSPISPSRPPLERRRAARLDYQSSHESILDGVPTDLAALEARLTEMMGYGFFQTVDENESQEEEEQSLQGSQQLLSREWEHFEFKLQLTEEQLKAKIEDLEVKTKDLQLKLGLKYTHGNLPYDIVLGNYESTKRRKASYMSEPMYTHPGGYRFRVEISPGGVGMAEDTHLSVDVLSLKGDYDPLLNFPVIFTITLQLLNQHSDQRHHQRNIECMYQVPGNKNEIGSEFEYILDERLEWNPAKETQYLLNNFLRFRLTKVVFSRVD